MDRAPTPLFSMKSAICIIWPAVSIMVEIKSERRNGLTISFNKYVLIIFIAKDIVS
jgi:hypothetical protein